MQVFRPYKKKRTASQKRWDKLVAGGSSMKFGPNKDKRARSRKGITK